jgi:hypothetical protein
MWFPSLNNASICPTPSASLLRPQNDGSYVVEFRTAGVESLAMSVSAERM